jgi:hypothetical protein
MKMADFQVGDKVHHSMMKGTGTVIDFTVDGMLVSFENGCHGSYDHGWFAKNPDLLKRLTQDQGMPG